MSDIPKDLQSAWSDAGKKIQDHETKALFGGVNIRVDLRKAFKAVYASAKLYFDVHAAATLSPDFVFKVGKDVYDVVLATLDALVEKMTPLEYAACVVLSQYEPATAVTEADFERSLRGLLELGVGPPVSWYFGLTRRQLKSAAEQLQATERFADVMTVLRKNDWLIERDGTIAFKPRHYTWRSRLE